MPRTSKQMEIDRLTRYHGFVLGSYKPYRVKLYYVFSLRQLDVPITPALTFNELYWWLKGYNALLHNGVKTR